MPHATETTLDAIRPWRDLYRQEMNCQVIHDSIHGRAGWSREYLLSLGDAPGEMPVGYGSVAVAGPWKDKPTVYEVFVVPQARGRVFDLFETLLGASGAVWGAARPSAGGVHPNSAVVAS